MTEIYWRDMDSAPKDGTMIRCRYHDLTLECRWEWRSSNHEDGGDWIAWELGEEVVPQSWHPLTAPSPAAGS